MSAPTTREGMWYVSYDTRRVKGIQDGITIDVRVIYPF